MSYLFKQIYSADGSIIRGESRRGRGKGRGGGANKVSTDKNFLSQEKSLDNVKVRRCHRNA